jgi:hypothetical protein
VAAAILGVPPIPPPPKWARKVPVANMRRFWDKMGGRGRDERVDHPGTDKRAKTRGA